MELTPKYSSPGEMDIGDCQECASGQRESADISVFGAAPPPEPTLSCASPGILRFSYLARVAPGDGLSDGIHDGFGPQGTGPEAGTNREK